MKQLGNLKKLSTQAGKAIGKGGKAIGKGGELLEPDDAVLTLQDMKTYLAARASEDEAFKRDLLDDPKAVWLREFSDINLDKVTVQILEATYDTLYLVVPDAAEKLRRDLVKRPKTVWQQEFGTDRLVGYTVRAVEETEAQLYLVLPYVAEEDGEHALPRWYRKTRLPARLQRSPQEDQTESEEQERENAIAGFAKKYRANQLRILPKGQLSKWFYYLGIGRVLRQVFRKPLDLFYKARNFVFRLMRPKV